MFTTKWRSESLGLNHWGYGQSVTGEAAAYFCSGHDIVPSLPVESDSIYWVRKLAKTHSLGQTARARGLLPSRVGD